MAIGRQSQKLYQKSLVNTFIMCCPRLGIHFSHTANTAFSAFLVKREDAREKLASAFSITIKSDVRLVLQILVSV